ncbi:hypothetical protein MS3_00010860 [Schistosoma haematobium]|uniref:Acyl carrier protein n=1 Tax=Schistosoma haematobium TaxID=6185 RepID=A0A922LDV0_SCHHA|nr:uncharacterized protein MS3_00010860 [Schistosoma haematobium]KAH9578278.1 hypothetical protein MS3_00010860 [Schistosoma haematobium]
MLVLRLYDKIDPYKITLNSRFNEDFGIDSLDHVELVMAIEEEFEFNFYEICGVTVFAAYWSSVFTDTQLIRSNT